MSRKGAYVDQYLQFGREHRYKDLLELIRSQLESLEDFSSECPSVRESHLRLVLIRRDLSFDHWQPFADLALECLDYFDSNFDERRFVEKCIMAGMTEAARYGQIGERAAIRLEIFQHMYVHPSFPRAQFEASKVWDRCLGMQLHLIVSSKRVPDPPPDPSLVRWLILLGGECPQLVAKAESYQSNSDLSERRQKGWAAVSRAIETGLREIQEQRDKLPFVLHSVTTLPMPLIALIAAYVRTPSWGIPPKQVVTRKCHIS